MSGDQSPNESSNDDVFGASAAGSRLEATANKEFVEVVLERMDDGNALSKEAMRKALRCSAITFKSFQDSAEEDWYNIITAYASDADAEKILEIVSDVLHGDRPPPTASCPAAPLASSTSSASPHCSAGCSPVVPAVLVSSQPDVASLARGSAADMHSSAAAAVLGGLHSDNPGVAATLQPQTGIFVSHSWDDGNEEFIKRLAAQLEQKTLASVWTDHDGLNQQQDAVVLSSRDALCRAQAVVVVLTPTYLTRPNCLRELRWALDFERAGRMSVVLVTLHAAVAFDGRLQLVQDGPLQGLVFVSKEKKVKRLCPEALALVERLNDMRMNTSSWQELQGWLSDDLPRERQEHATYSRVCAADPVALAGGLTAQPFGLGLVERVVSAVKERMTYAAPRPVCECAQMDDTLALTACDVTSTDEAFDVLDLTRYLEAAAATVKSEMEARRLVAGRATKEAAQKHVVELAAAARSLRRRCLHATAGACLLVLLLLLRRAGGLQLLLQRLRRR